MTQEEKQLLLKDLCERLPYGVMIEITTDDGIMEVSYDMRLDAGLLADLLHSEDDFKPYLRPMSSMTEEEKKELSRKYNWRITNSIIQIRYHSDGYWDDETDCPTEEYFNLLNWLNKHHFDYRDLIEKGLAIEAPEGMYKTE